MVQWVDVWLVEGDRAENVHRAVDDHLIMELGGDSVCGELKNPVRKDGVHVGVGVDLLDQDVADVGPGYDALASFSGIEGDVCGRGHAVGVGHLTEGLVLSFSSGSAGIALTR